MAASSSPSAAALRILVLSGPNLQLLGTREPGIYGSTTLPEIHANLDAFAKEHGASVDCRQSNHEGDLLDWIGAAPTIGHDGIVINPGAYTHYSYAIYDALLAVRVPAVEVHISDISRREAFRRTSVTAPACRGQIVGHGFRGYLEAMELLESIHKEDMK